MKNKLNQALKYIIIFNIIGLMVINTGCSYHPSNTLTEPGNNLNSIVKEYSDPGVINLDKAEISLSFEGRKLNLTHPVFVDYNRYYLPLTEFVTALNGKISMQDGKAYIEDSDNKIEIGANENYFTVNSKKENLKKNTFTSQNTLYVTLFDLTKMFKLKVNWDDKNNFLDIYRNRTVITTDRQPDNGKNALIRFEDVTADQRYATSESLEKMRIIFDYCYSRNIPMHLGWVPRYIDPIKKIDNAPADNYSFHNADFVYTLDYFTDKNGFVGLHGYTHQFGNEVSLSGIEFNSSRNNTEASVRKILDTAVDNAKKLDIPICFFESPHYAATPFQKKIFEQYFNNIYEYKTFYMEQQISKVTRGDRVITYIPTPLGYLGGKSEINYMLGKIEALEDDTLASLFYHPSIEFDSIKIKKDANGYPYYTYSENSPLKRIFNTLIKKGYTLRDLNSL